MTLKIIIKLLLFFFVPTSLLGLFYLFENKIDIHSTYMANIIAVVVVPLYLAFVGNIIILDNDVSSKAVKLFIVLLSAIATVHAINMLFLSYDVWKHVLLIPTQLDGISKMVLNIIIGLSLGVLIISYPVLNAIISKFRN